jgi:hypothetical protein
LRWLPGGSFRKIRPNPADAPLEQECGCRPTAAVQEPIRRAGRASHHTSAGWAVERRHTPHETNLSARRCCTCSVFARRVKSGHKTGASEGSGDLKPGDEIDCDAGVKGGKLETRDAAGTITGLTDESITVTGEHEATCAIPAEFDLGDYGLGDKVGMYCFKADGIWTLKAPNSLDPPPPAIAYVTVTGSITALGDGKITVQGDREPVTAQCPTAPTSARSPSATT